MQQAPLHTTADLIPPAGGKAKFVEGLSGKLRYASWKVSGKSRGTVLICHGFVEFIEKYYEVIGYLLERKFNVVIFEWQGHGMSDLAPIEPVHSFDLYADDLQAVLNQMGEDKLPKPWLGLGHSMGGNLLLAGAKDHPDVFAGIVLIAPMLGINTLDKSPWTNQLSRFLVAFPYSLFLRFPIATPQRYTSDLHRYIRADSILLDHPQLKADIPLIPWYNGAKNQLAITQGADWASKIKTPTQILIAGEDILVSNAATEQVAAQLPNCQLDTIKDAQHEILMERDELRDQAWKTIDRFFKKLLTPTSGN